MQLFVWLSLPQFKAGEGLLEVWKKKIVLCVYSYSDNRDIPRIVYVVGIHQHPAEAAFLAARIVVAEMKNEADLFCLGKFLCTGNILTQFISIWMY